MGNEINYFIDTKDCRAYITHGYLHYEDAAGMYEIPIEKKSREVLLVLENSEKGFERHLELDLITGAVYYCYDSNSSAGLTWTYDMSSKKCSNHEVLRRLRSIHDDRFQPSPEVRNIIRQLPCENWIELVEQLPGWKDKIEHRYDRLLLPEGPVTKIDVSGQKLADPQDPVPGSDTLHWSDLTAIELEKEHSHLGTHLWKHVFSLQRKGGYLVLHYNNDNEGTEFTRQDELYERNLSETEYRWILTDLAKEIAPADAAGENIESADLVFGDVRWKVNLSQAFFDRILKFLRREIEIIE